MCHTHSYHHSRAVNAGFSLVEITVVLVLIGILTALAIPRYRDAGRNAREAEAAPLLKQVHTLQERHLLRTERYADSFADLEGAAAPIEAATYYLFEMNVAEDGSAYTVCATPKTENTRYVRINERGQITKDPDGCE